MYRRALITLATLFVFAAFAWAQSVYTPKPGTAERKALMDALRIPVEKDVKQKVIFKVYHLKVSGSWAFVRAVPQKPDGSLVDYKNTKYQEALEAGMFDECATGLLQKRSGKWKVVTFVIGPTDVVWEDWDKRYGAPKAIFLGAER
jgi:hypothetical protein